MNLNCILSQGVSNLTSSQMTILQSSLFSQLLLKIQTTCERNIVDRSKSVYESHLYGKFGWVTFVDNYNVKYSKTISSGLLKRGTDGTVLLYFTL